MPGSTKTKLKQYTPLSAFRFTKVKTHTDMSEETVCFSAIIVKAQGGKFLSAEVGSVKNDGRGGSDFIDLPPVMYKEFLAEAKRLFPEESFMQEEFLSERLREEAEMLKHAKKYLTYIEAGKEDIGYSAIMNGRKKARANDENSYRFLCKNAPEGSTLVSKNYWK